jgi:hypothetical protein
MSGPEVFERESSSFKLLEEFAADASSAAGYFAESLACKGDAVKWLADDLCVPESPGFPGTLFSTVFQLRITVNELRRTFRDYQEGCESRIRETFAGIDAIRAEEKRLIDADVAPFDEAARELARLALSLNVLPSLPTRDARRAIAERTWPRYSQRLSLYRAKRSAARAGCGERRPSVAEVSHTAAVRRLFGAFSESLAALGGRICESALALQALSATVDYASDFRAFIAREGLRFFDVPPPPFERFKFASPYRAPYACVIERFAMPYLPALMAVARADFAPASDDELPLRRGGAFYLMQAPREAWVFAMARHGEHGWVPAAFVEVVGVGIAVILDKAGAPTFEGKSRSIVAVAGAGDDGRVRCIDARGNPVIAERSALALL